APTKTRITLSSSKGYEPSGGERWKLHLNQPDKIYYGNFLILPPRKENTTMTGCVTQFSFSGLACHRTSAVTCGSTPEGSYFETVTVPWSELAMTRTSTCIYHFFVLSWYIFLNFYISQQGEDRRKSEVFLNGGQWKYLTFLNLALFYGVACLEDVLKRAKGKKDIKFITAFRDLLFTTLAFPISAFVFLSFWILFLYDRELVYPKALDGIFPVWLNHAMTKPTLERETMTANNDQKMVLGNNLSCNVTIKHKDCLIYFPVHVNMGVLHTNLQNNLDLLAPLPSISSLYWEDPTTTTKTPQETSCLHIESFIDMETRQLRGAEETKKVTEHLSYIFSVGIYLFGEKLNHWKWGKITNLLFYVDIPIIPFNFTHKLPVSPAEDIRMPTPGHKSIRKRNPIYKIYQALKGAKTKQELSIWKPLFSKAKMYVHLQGYTKEGGYRKSVKMCTDLWFTASEDVNLNQLQHTLPRLKSIQKNALCEITALSIYRTIAKIATEDEGPQAQRRELAAVPTEPPPPVDKELNELVTLSGGNAPVLRCLQDHQVLGIIPEVGGRPDIGDRQAGHSIVIPDKWPEPEASVWTIKCGTSFLLETSRHLGWTLTHGNTRMNLTLNKHLIRFAKHGTRNTYEDVVHANTVRQVKRSQISESGTPEIHGVEMMDKETEDKIFNPIIITNINTPAAPWTNREEKRAQRKIQYHISERKSKMSYASPSQELLKLYHSFFNPKKNKWHCRRHHLTNDQAASGIAKVTSMEKVMMNHIRMGSSEPRGPGTRGGRGHAGRSGVMGSQQVQPPTGLSSSPREDEQTRDSEEAEAEAAAAAAAALAAAAPAASLPTLLPPTLEEPPPPPAAAPGRSCARARVPTSPALPGAAAHAHSPSSRDPSPFDSRPAPKPSSSCFARARAREADGAEPRPAGTLIRWQMVSDMQLRFSNQGTRGSQPLTFHYPFRKKLRFFEKPKKTVDEDMGIGEPAELAIISKEHVIRSGSRNLSCEGGSTIFHLCRELTLRLSASMKLVREGKDPTRGSHSRSPGRENTQGFTSQERQIIEEMFRLLEDILLVIELWEMTVLIIVGNAYFGKLDNECKYNLVEPEAFTDCVCENVRKIQEMQAERSQTPLGMSMALGFLPSTIDTSQKVALAETDHRTEED
ncbi:hypothetical protein EI555_017897, partial [Monodon monoceros]